MTAAAARPRTFLDPASLQRLGGLDVIARTMVEGARVGAHRSPLHGFSTEFAQHRPYVPGDEIRHMDWRLYARAQRYYIKQYRAETDLTVHLLLDGSQSMRFSSGGPDKLTVASYLAAGLAFLVYDQNDRVSFSVFDGESRQVLPPSGSAAGLQSLDAALRSLEAKPKTDVAGALHGMADGLSRRSMVAVFSDLFDQTDAFLDGLGHLRHRGHDVAVFHTLDPAEMRFLYDGTVKFIGLENDGSRVAQPRRIRAAYLEALHRFLFRVKDACERTRAQYVPVETHHPPAEALLEFLLGRARRGRT